ncbi:assimilatory sulfite reductase (NADPH) flavoprotein subunit [Staphylococcus gallinarum]|uniref:assimilatory sulfite reductase (NADPH) n=1 Tax=Staphylococcus gallinarum TaxID=1293 RepID=A0A418HPK6_STAGA|nr:assimilatory sulfite reductase (NADPH) flavoprotein subunit [Staphylococcus gallinarum]MCD8826372.1 assimilatory sulfite reductase (NADPH) flavoprotein subunit [Staphylococcus gallinarum]PTE80342.1 assimilatory sulfite reductase (NADPH) flavoprotein subunit [Staphylococcus gallinarum]RIL43232.1 assimilatory sulfite reductase (NADPH) flavoprotein subunit [Staphylococcus gallinarum]RIO90517.1 assimilatory sulfite reductase (NADPH) flavoprotein subunit [Staphylococcus gallinarum]
MQLNQSNTPFDTNQLDLINQLLPMLSAEQKHWLSGYLINTSVEDYASETDTTSTASSSSSTSAAPSVETVATEDTQTVTEPLDVHILFGTETGNAEEVSEQFETTLKSHNFNVHLWDMDDFPKDKLTTVDYVFIICSTQGVGEPPINAIDLYEYLHGDTAPRLESLNYSVLALGDQDFPDFCQAGKDFDHILEQLGANRIAERVDCDFDFEETSEQWMADMVELLSARAPDKAKETATAEEVALETHEEGYSKDQPYEAKVIDNTVLTAPEATREVRHLSLSLAGYGESYEPGDSLVIIPENAPSLVNKLIHVLGWEADTTVQIGKDAETITVKEAFTKHFEISKLSPSLIKQAADVFKNPMLRANAQKDTWITNYIYGRDLIDLVTDFSPYSIEPQTLIDILRKLPPREYSIASSNKVNADSVHLTVRVVRYDAYHRERLGVCSGQLAERTPIGDSLPVYLKKNPNFKFSYDNNTATIMIGAGTGIAPYRAYLQEREYLGLAGNQWLIFGNQNYSTDYLYQTDLERWLNDGVLSKLDLAFSRDTENKIYVQHRIEENGAEFYRWLEDGATIYLCGDKEDMAKGVHQSLVNVVMQHGGYDETAAEHYLTELIKAQRYQRDVY